MSGAVPTAISAYFSLGPVEARVEERLAAWAATDFPGRLWSHDPTLWAEKGTPEIEDRLGWLELPRTMRPRLAELLSFAEEVREAGFREVVLLGMGGSSLAPEVFQSSFGNAPGSPRLTVLDSTHPAAVAAVDRGLRLESTLFVVSSKSGTTLETKSLAAYFWDRAERELEDPGSHFVAVTDPGSSLADLGEDRGYRRVFLAPPDVGGRYSALTPFGLVPAALIGADVEAMLDAAANMAGRCGPTSETTSSPGLVLGAVLGELALAGRDKLTLFTSPGIASLPDWIEQLVAESTGKDGVGIVPVVGEPDRKPGAYGGDRFFVGIALVGDGEDEVRERLGALASSGHPVAYLEVDDVPALGAEMYRWEVAVAAAGSVLGIQPFDQPDVQLAKTMAQEAMAASAPAGAGDVPVVSAGDPAGPGFAAWVGTSRPGDYLAVQAFVAPDMAMAGRLRRLAARLGETTGLAVTVGWGPRFLHSTGQLHKGGADNGCFLQLFDAARPALAVPGTDFGFDRLVQAQALGDALALRSRGRRLLRVDLGEDAAAGLDAVARWLGA